MSSPRDYCTGVPDWDIWVCCEEHDRAYENKDVPRAVADAHLLRCIVDHGVKRGRVGRYTLLAGLYYAGVRMFGGRFWHKARPPLRRLRRRVAQAQGKAGRLLNPVA